MVKTKEELLQEAKDAVRTFEEDTSLGQLQDRITELEQRIEVLENG